MYYHVSSDMKVPKKIPANFLPKSPWFLPKYKVPEVPEILTQAWGRMALYLSSLEIWSTYSVLRSPTSIHAKLKVWSWHKKWCEKHPKNPIVMTWIASNDEHRDTSNFFYHWLFWAFNKFDVHFCQHFLVFFLMPGLANQQFLFPPHFEKYLWFLEK